MRVFRVYVFLGCCLPSFLLAIGCSTPSPPRSASRVVHQVKTGETIYRIARYYQVSTERIVRANRIRDVREIRPGQRLLIPGSRKATTSRALRPPGGQPKPPVPGVPSAFGWPVKGVLTSRYGWRRGRVHEGIDIAAKSGAAVVAARDGRVIYSGNGLGAYGNVVIVRHKDDFETVYAHNRRNRVRRGERVRRGQLIAEVGATGNATGPHVHFEIRAANRARDPLGYLR